MIAFHQSGFRNFKTFYVGYVCQHLQAVFPDFVSYNRFIEFIGDALVPLFTYLHSLFGRCSGISFIDFTPLGVCDNYRIKAHKVFKGIAAKRGKTSTGWFFGFKLHLVVSDTGELLNLTLMKPQGLSSLDKMLLRKRAIIESVIDQLKNISQVEHTRHRASTGFLWNLAASLIAYCHQPKKPSFNLNLGPAIVLT